MPKTFTVHAPRASFAVPACFVILFVLASLAVYATCAYGAARGQTPSITVTQTTIQGAENAVASSTPGAVSAGGIPLAVQVIASEAILDHGAAPERARVDGTDYTAVVPLSGRQDEIDLCAGLVDTTTWYGTASVVEHWDCGGASFPRWTGARVRLSGAQAGLYEVTGVLGYLSHGTAMVSNIPHGHDLVFQTCLNGDSSRMVLVGLERVG
jgi:hypothetical protein